MADNTIVGAIDRTKVTINDKEGVDHDTALLAMRIGDEYSQISNHQDLKFFLDVELGKNGGLIGEAGKMPCLHLCCFYSPFRTRKEGANRW